MRPIRLSIILPCFNEEGNLPALLEGFAAVWEDLPAELIVVDNGSTDDTPQMLERIRRRPGPPLLRTIRVDHNRGYGHGIMTGLRAARGELLGYSHADLQCDPADLFTAYRALAADAQPSGILFKGARARRRLGAELITGGMGLFATTILSMPLTDINAQPKMFHRSLLERLTDPPDGFQFDLYLLYTARRAGLRIGTIPVTFGRRAHGESKWSSTFLSRYRTIRDTITYTLHLRHGDSHS